MPCKHKQSPHKADKISPHKTKLRLHSWLSFWQGGVAVALPAVLYCWRWLYCIYCIHICIYLVAALFALLYLFISNKGTHGVASGEVTCILTYTTTTLSTIPKLPWFRSLDPCCPVLCLRVINPQSTWKWPIMLQAAVGKELCVRASAGGPNYYLHWAAICATISNQSPATCPSPQLLPCPCSDLMRPGGRGHTQHQAPGSLYESKLLSVDCFRRRGSLCLIKAERVILPSLLPSRIFLSFAILSIKYRLKCSI